MTKVEQEMQVLRRADEILADESRWTRMTHARDKFGDDVEYDSDAAVCFCIEGAMLRAQKELGLPEGTATYPMSVIARHMELMRPCRVNFPRFVSAHNDSMFTTFEDVKRGFSKALEAYRANHQ